MKAFFLFFLVALSVSVRAQKGQTLHLIDSLLKDNTGKSIRARDFRTVLKNIVDLGDSVALNKITKGNASLNQVLKWNGSAWAPGNDLVGGGNNGGATWGAIPGTLSDQTDLQLILNSKLNISDTTSLLQKVTAASLYQAKGSYLTTTAAASTYQPIGGYLTGITSGQVTTALGYTPYNSTNPNGYITASAITGKLNISDTTSLLQKTTAASLYQAKGSYLTTTSAASTYQPIGSYLTGITSGQVTTALGYTPYNSTNPNGYITASAITGKLNISDTTSLLQKTTAASLYQAKGSYLTTTAAASTYQPIGSYLTGITSGQVTTALGYTPYNSTNPNGYITTSAITGKLNISDTTSLLQKATAASLYQAKGSYLTTTAAASTYQPIGSYQNAIQYRDEGTNTGTSGGISTINFTGAGVVSSVSGSTLTADVKDYESLVIAASDRFTSISVGTDKETIPMPFAMTVTEVRAYLNTAQTSGSLFRVDIMENGLSILSTQITLDNGEKSSTTAVTLPVISDTVLAKNSEIRIDVTQIGDGTARGLKVIIDGYRN